MTDKQEIKFAMLIAVRDFIAARTPDLNTLPGFEDHAEQFAGIVSQIQEVRMEQLRDSVGVSLSKADVRKELITLAFDMSRKLVAFAQSTSNITLRNEVDYSKSEMRKAKDPVLKDRCGIITQWANTYQEVLDPFGATEESVTALSTKMADFLAAIPKPKEARNIRKSVTEKIKSLLEQGDVLLKEHIDILIDTIELAAPDVYKDYRRARTLISEYGTRKLAVMVNVTDAAGLPLARVGARVEGSSITKKTSEKGKFRMDNMPAGTYIFNFSKGGYKPVSARVIVNDGETAKLDVVMETIPAYVGVPA